MNNVSSGEQFSSPKDDMGPRNTGRLLVLLRRNQPFLLDGKSKENKITGPMLLSLGSFSLESWPADSRLPSTRIPEDSAMREKAIKFSRL